MAAVDPIDEWIATAVPERLRATATAVIALFAEEVPRVKLTMERVPVWFFHGRMAWLTVGTRTLTLGFWRGAQMRDPKCVLRGSAKLRRSVTLRANDEEMLALVRGFARQAAKLNREKGDPS